MFYVLYPSVTYLLTLPRSIITIRYIATGCVTLVGYLRHHTDCFYISKINIACPVENRHVIFWLLAYADHISLK
jgi:hypothetical protein